MNSFWAKANLFLVPAASFALTALLVPLISRLAQRWKCVALPNKERWHTRPTPMLGGLAFFLGFLAPVLLLSIYSAGTLSFFAITILLFAVGLYDDLYRISPTTKLMGQIIVAAIALFFGYSLNFFTWKPLDHLLTAVWIVGLTNAVNLLDNMDGLATGIGLIAASYLAFLFNQQGDVTYTLLALALAGALAGFLVYNFYPASIFMGDAGSLFLGSSLSLLTIHANGQASNILSLVAVPACILLVPILDTTLVTITRLLRGQPVSQGGKDHASHRLVILGLNEPQAVLLLYFMATISGASAFLIKWFSYSLSFAILPVIILSFALFTAYLAQVEIVSEPKEKERSAKKLTVLLSTLTYKGRILEVVLDFFLMAFAYYLAFALRFDFRLSDFLLNLFLISLPVVVIATYLSFFVFGVYRGLWRYTDLEDVARIACSVFVGTLTAVGILVAFYRFAGYSRVVFILYALLLFFGMAGSRVSFRLFGLWMAGLLRQKVPVLVYGAGDGGEVVVRECRQNPHVNFQPIGFLDDDPKKQGTAVLGLPIFGSAESLPQILEKKNIQGCIISSASILKNGHGQEIRTLCNKRGLWIKQLRLDFVQEETDEGTEHFYLRRSQSSILDSWD